MVLNGLAGCTGAETGPSTVAGDGDANITAGGPTG